MRVPAANVGEGGFNAEVGLEQLGDLLHVVAEFVEVGIVDAGAGLVLGRIGGAEHLDGFEGLFAGGVEDAVAAVAVHGLEGVGGGRGSGAAAADGEAVDVGERDGGNLAGQCARNLEPRARARKAVCSWRWRRSSACRARLSQPSSVLLTPGVPDSM
jgi:hypothetical protein